MAKSYEVFISEFTKVDGNYKLSQIFDNSAFYFGNDDTKLDKAFFGHRFYEEHVIQLRNLMYDKCFQDEAFKTMAEFRDMGLPLNMVTWMRLRSALLSAKTRLKKTTLLEERRSRAINVFFQSFRKGSRNMRNVLNYDMVTNTSVNDLRIITTFSELTNSTVPSNLRNEICLGSWSISALSINLKSFSFKFRNNILPLTNRVANFDQNIDPICKFCRIIDEDTAQRESFSDCFFDCKSINNFLYLFNKEFFGELDPERIKSGYWFGYYCDTDSLLRQQMNIIVFDIFRFVIFKSKCRNILPTYMEIRKQTLFLIKTTIFKNFRLRTKMTNDGWYARIVTALG
jgi:hypothetical protein